MSSRRETWTSRVGFIIAAVGSAVGLGNIWSFPFQTASNGGAAFLVVYLLTVFLIGFPAMLVEFVIGRGTQRNPVDAFTELGFGEWSIAGKLGVFTAFVTLSFYSVVGGWVLSYLAGSVTGSYFGDAAGYFGAISAGPVAIGAHAVFMAITIGIVAYGVAHGIETATKVMVPALVVLLVGLAAWVTTLPNAAAGYAYYLTPDVGALTANISTILPSAVGQAFFTLSLGFSIMIAYSSYIGRDDSLAIDGGTIVVVNTLVAVLAGFVVFPVLFSLGIDPGSGGAGTAFVTLGGAFGQLPAGAALGFLFFLVLLLAALSSSISLLEVPVSYLVDNYDYARWKVAVALGVVVFVVGIPAATGTGTLGWYNDVVFNLLLPLVVLLLAVFVGWVGSETAVDELGRGSSLSTGLRWSWLWWVRVLIPIAIGLTLVLGVQDLLVKAGVLEAAVFLG